MPFYLVHCVVLTFVLWGDSPANRLWAGPVAFPLAIFLAWTLTHYYEKPVARCIVAKLAPRAGASGTRLPG